MNGLSDGMRIVKLGCGGGHQYFLYVLGIAADLDGWTAYLRPVLRMSTVRYGMDDDVGTIMIVQSSTLVCSFTNQPRFMSFRYNRSHTPMVS